MASQRKLQYQSMPSTDITQKTVAKAKGDAKPGNPRYEITDTRARGLRLRVGPQGVIWQFRYKRDTKTHRVLIGDVDEWTIAEARQIASDAAAKLRAQYGLGDDFMHHQRIKHAKIFYTAPSPPDDRQLLKWSLETSIKNYLAEVERALKPATYADYRRMLGTPELKPFLKLPVATIRRQDLAGVVAAVHHRGVERHAEHLASVLRPLWTFLERDDLIRKTGVTPGEMKTLSAPRRSRVGTGEKRKAKYLPSMLEVGRILAIARSGAFNPVTSAALELLVFTCQRITPIAAAERVEFRYLGKGEGLWSMPAQHRKTALKRGDLSDHAIPLPAPAWSAIKTQLDNDTPYAFPAARPRRKGDEAGAMASSNLSHALRYMPGMSATPHDLRRAFGTHGENQFKWKKEGSKLILDHNEGVTSGDVTAVSYDLDQSLDEKWPIMRSWAAWVEEWAAQAVKQDRRLADHGWLKSEVQRARDADKKKAAPGSEAA